MQIFCSCQTLQQGLLYLPSPPPSLVPFQHRHYQSRVELQLSPDKAKRFIADDVKSREGVREGTIGATWSALAVPVPVQHRLHTIINK